MSPRITSLITLILKNSKSQLLQFFPRSQVINSFRKLIKAYLEGEEEEEDDDDDSEDLEGEEEEDNDEFDYDLGLDW